MNGLGALPCPIRAMALPPTSFSMSSSPTPVHPLIELELRQDEVLEQLDELERRVEAALTEFAAIRLAACPPRRGEQAARAA